jgi:hypothetical protein
MKNLLAIGCATACLLLVGCGGSDDGNSVTKLDSSQVRPSGGEQVPAPGSGIKLGSNSSGGPGSAAPKEEGK